MNEERLPEYFPLKLKKCRVPADAFFACFEVNSFDPEDVDAGKKALLTCKDQLKLYKECMDNYVGPNAKKSSGYFSWLYSSK